MKFGLVALRADAQGNPAINSTPARHILGLGQVSGSGANGAKIRPVWDSFSPRRPRWASDFAVSEGSSLCRPGTEQKQELSPTFLSASRRSNTTPYLRAIRVSQQ